MTYRVSVTATALSMLAEVKDRRAQRQLRERIDGLAHEPESQGKPLRDELAGFRSLRVAGQRYRIVFRVERKRVVVLVVALGRRAEGSRRDVYALAQKLLRLGLVEPPR